MLKKRIRLSVRINKLYYRQLSHWREVWCLHEGLFFRSNGMAN